MTRIVLHHFLLSVLFLSLGPCQPADRQGLATRTFVPPPEADRHVLMEAYRQQGAVTLVFGKKFDAPEYGWIRELDGREAGGIRYRVTWAEDLRPEDVAGQILHLVGTPADNPWLRELADGLPFGWEEEAFRFAGRSFASPDLLFRLAFFPNPRNRRLPMMATVGLEPERVLREFQNLLDGSRRRWWRQPWDYELFLGEERRLLGAFRDTGWTIDPERHFDFTAEAEVLLRAPHFQLIGDPAMHRDTSLPDFLQKLEREASRVLEFAGSEQVALPLPIHLYATAEAKGLILNDTRQQHVDWQQGAVHAVYNDTYRQVYASGAHALLLTRVLGVPHRECFREGLAVYFTEGWQGRGHAEWSLRLRRAEAFIPLRELLDDERFGRTSRLIRGALSGALVEFLIERYGREAMVKAYASGALPADLDELDEAWNQYWNARAVGSIWEGARASGLPYLKGFNFSHEGYSIYNGYISTYARRALTQISELEANAVAIVPYSYLRDPQQPAFIPVTESAVSENDESVVHAAFSASELGLTTLLKPQLWLGRGQWPGDVDMRTQADWDAFFAYYGEWILHYALLAEIHGLDALCVGTEFAKATLAQPEAWRQLIRRVREVYSGPLTYAANWGSEFEGIDFWEELDYIGLDCYYPLSNRKAANKGELKKGFAAVCQKVEAVHRRFGRPVLLTEIGFRSSEAPWKQPHAEAASDKYNGKHQELAYQAVLESLAEADWCQGVLWWKYPTYLGNQDAENTRFTPQGKPAEQVVREWFGKL